MGPKPRGGQGTKTEKQGSTFKQLDEFLDKSTDPNDANKTVTAVA